VNKTPIDWYSKKQAIVETATYGSEFVAARICVEQIIDLRNTLRFLGVPVREKSYMFDDNKSVVDSSMQLNAKLHKCHTLLSFHHAREAIAAGILGFTTYQEMIILLIFSASTGDICRERKDYYHYYSAEAEEIQQILKFYQSINWLHFG
jgi:hypothetical protein